MGATASFKRVKFNTNTKKLVCAMKDKVPQKKNVAQNTFYFSVLLFNLRKKNGKIKKWFYIPMLPMSTLYLTNFSFLCTQ